MSIAARSYFQDSKNCLVVISGSGTSGRLAFFVAVSNSKSILMLVAYVNMTC